ncbi:hypothetical protein JCM17845_24180 [Iodidimonas gelatinilytica]|uniref:Pentapeptide repeat-containing protein n=1 Tax=Iodidimonas gelatinilytica TaxID=1236966 RepID=A0A5A7N286_9PROT|nr:pentapeptide repeat-containing protein [Iodidimonas gelatinilytica]GER01795.1 hypothetical protein JCM17845_24180 [Iodidimonas gelatinilytica]
MTRYHRPSPFLAIRLMRFSALLWATFLMGLSVPAFAGCSDAPRPGVEWTRCFMNGRQFQDIDIQNGIVRDSSFSRATLDRANLSGLDGRRAKFMSASLKNVNLSGANLIDADFTKADLSGADLSHADLRGARLFQTNLGGANLTQARLEDADLYRTDFTGATWIDGTTICAEGSIGTCK